MEKTSKTKPEIQHPKDKNPAANCSKHPTSQKICRICGGQYPHYTICPEKRKIFHYCKKPNHFKTFCNKLKRKQVQLVSDENSAETDSDESDEYCYTITTETDFINSVKHNLPQVSLKLNNVDTSLLIDIGSTVNIIDEETHQKKGKPTLQKIRKPNLYPCGTSNPLRILGQCELLIETNHKIQCHKFFVTKCNHGSLMGYQTAQALNLVKILQNINDPTGTYQIFKGIGKLKDTQVKIHVDESVKPVAQKPPRVTFHLPDKVELEIQKLSDEDIIEKVQGDPTPWVSPIVVVSKKDSESVRISV